MADAAAVAREIMNMSGLEALQAIVEGRLPMPSIGTTLGFRLAEVGEGWSVFEGEPSDRILNPLGVVHGGFALTLIDSCTGCAVHTTLPAGVGYTTLETKANLVRAITPQTGLLRAEGRVVAQGRTVATAEGKVVDAQGKIYAHGTSTLLIMRPEKKA